MSTKNHSHDEHFAFSEDYISREVTLRFGFDELNLLNWLPNGIDLLLLQFLNETSLVAHVLNRHSNMKHH